jgi:UDP-N-acetylglucosamine 2-epimerase (non-hydrolysing)
VAERDVKRVICLFGTRPEIIKFSPVLRALEGRGDRFETLRVSSSQHTDLLHPFAKHFGIEIDRDLAVMRENQSPASVAARVLDAFDPVLAEADADLVLVQGDTTTAMAGALAAFFRGVPVGHIEAGLRTGNLASPFPEEMNRRLITRLARFHFAATDHNVATLRREGIAKEAIALTGNPVVDALERTVANSHPSAALPAVREPRLLVLTTHRRESFGPRMRRHLEVLRDFVTRHDDVALAFPVHPNPQVREPTEAVLAGTPRIHLLDPLGYPEFVALLGRAWLVVSDSGGIQEEAPTLGKALLVLRENTERPEAVSAGVARLVGDSPDTLATALEALHADDAWIRGVEGIPNPFGQGDAGERIADAIEGFLSDASPLSRGRALSDFVGDALQHVEEISPEEAHRIFETVNCEGWHFIDVREADEFDAGHVPGARHYPRGFLEVRADLVHPKRDAWLEDRDRPLILYCGGGHRSALAASSLREMGFTHLRSLARGWTGWTKRGYPIEG